jgi:hypothetical protein
VTGGAELNPGPPVDQWKIDQVLAHVLNQEESEEIIIIRNSQVKNFLQSFNTAF